MSLKTKLITLFLLCLLMVPVFIGPRTAGNVLGAQEKRSIQDTLTNTSSVKQIGEIGSGAIDFKTVENTNPKGKIYQGRAIWDSKAQTPVSTDKFGLGKGLAISSKNEKLSLVVGDVRVLPNDVLLILDKKTFTDLGGDIQKDQSLEISVIPD